MNSRAAVAVILAVGVVLIILSGTPMRFAFIDPMTPGTPIELAAMWKDLVLVIVGILAGYISGKDDK